MAEEEKRTGARKKIYVQSRYKQAAENVGQRSSRSRERSYLRVNKDSQGCNSSSEGGSCSESNTLQGTRVTSTPNSKGGRPLPSLNESAVSNILSLPPSKEKIGLSCQSVRRNLGRKMKPRIETLSESTLLVSYKKKGDHYDPNWTEKEMDILYAQYLQMVFLESEAKRVQAVRSNNATETLLKLCELVTGYTHQVKSQQLQLQLANSIMKIYDHLLKQEAILQPVYEVNPSFFEKYKHLVETIANNQNKLPLKDVLRLDHNSEGYVAVLLKEIFSMIAKFLDSVPKFEETICKVEALQKSVEKGHDVSTALERAFNLLMEARDLFFSEASILMDWKSEV